MNKSVVAIASAALLAGSAGAAAAHHTTAQYDNQHPVEVKAIVKEFAPNNPHMQLTLVVNDAKGSRALDLEGQSVNNMYRMGYRRGMISVGDTITVTYSPLKPGMQGFSGLFRTIVLADGHVLGGGGTGRATTPGTPAAAPPATNR